MNFTLTTGTIICTKAKSSGAVCELTFDYGEDKKERQRIFWIRLCSKKQVFRSNQRLIVKQKPKVT